MRTFAIALAAAAALWMTGCGDSTDSTSDLLDGIPDSESLRVKLPGGSTAQSALTVQPKGALTNSALGQTGEFYTFTRQMTEQVNSGVYQLLLMIDDIAHQPATTKETDKWIWGPYTPGGLDPGSYRVTIQKTGDKDYTWSLEEKPKDADDDAFKQAMGGTHTSGARPRRGAGTIALDFDAMAAVDATKPERGQADVTYQSDTYPVTVTVAFRNFVGQDKKPPADSDYHYTENQDGSGEFSFAIGSDIDNKGKDEDVKVMSRWLADGRGRSDVRITGGDLTAQSITEIVAVECWDKAYLRTYFEDWATTTAQGKINIDPTQGDAATCAYTDQKLPE